MSDHFQIFMLSPPTFCELYKQSLSKRKGAKIMRAWAEKRRRQMEEIGALELARMFELVSRICELDEQLGCVRHPTVQVRPECTRKAQFSPRGR